MPDVFISYSRSNKAFAQRIYDSLVEAGLSVWIDWNDIAISADWFNDILRNIEAADNIIFILSPDSLISIFCHLELAHARKHNKRLIPVIYKEANQHEFLATLAATPLDKIATDALAGQMILQVAADNYVAVQRHNWLLVRDEDDFDERMKVLVNTINTDLHHVGQHTRFLIRARLWESKNQQPGYLLSPTEIAEAAIWLQQAEATDKEPAPTGLQKDYIKQSRQFHRKKRMSTGASAMILLMVALVIGVGLAFAFNLLPKSLRMLHGSINIAVADFSLLDAGATESRSDSNGTILAKIIGNVINKMPAIAEINAALPAGVDLEAGNLRTILGQSQKEQHTAAQLLAHDINAHILIYGMIDNTSSKPTFQLQYYVTRSVADADELTGSDIFGDPIEIDLPITSSDSSKDPDIGNTLTLFSDKISSGRIDALTKFIIGLGYLKEKHPELALDWLDRARKEPSWYESDEKDKVDEKNKGKEIIYFWMGVASGQLQGDNPCRIQVPQSLVEETNQYYALDKPVKPSDCRIAFFRRALELNPKYVRAEMGIANAYASAAKFHLAGNLVVDCKMYLKAKDAYDNLLPLLDQAQSLENADLIRFKAYYNIGLVNSEIQLASDSPSCIQQSNTAYEAIVALNNAITLYPAFTEEYPEAYRIAADSYYHLGLMYKVLKQYDKSDDALTQAISISTAQQSNFQEDWQSIEYAARSQRGYVWFNQALNGDLSLLDKAVAEYTRVIEAYPKLFSDEIIVNQTLFYRALAYEAAGNIAYASADYCALSKRELLPYLRKQLLPNMEKIACPGT